MLTFINDEGEEVQVPKPTPDFVDAMLSQVEAGELTLEEGIIASLRVMVGEAAPEEVFGDQPVSFVGGRRLILLAVELYQSTTNESVKAEIARLLNIISPPQENIDRYALPEEEAAKRPPGFAKPERSDPEGAVACESIWASGFPTDVVDPPVCLLYRSFMEEGFEYRLYYPEERRGDAAFLEYVEASVEALRESRAVYDPLSEIRSINLIFTLLPSPLGFLAEVPRLEEPLHGGAPCPISVFPLALGDEIAIFKQTIAHEVFHCLHFFRVGSLGTDAETWYVEGMAEYFSNVVYPTVNDEHRRAEEFDIRSASESLLDMSYVNAIFFQHLGNRFGNAYLLDLLDVLAAAGGTSETQAAALAGFGDMQTVIHEFGQAYLMKNIPDTGGGRWPINIYIHPYDYFDIGEGGDVLVLAAPFTLARFRLNFDEDREYAIARNVDGAAGEDSWRPPLPEGFVDIPDSLRTSCQTDPERTVLLTSATDSLTAYTNLELSFTSSETGYMDCCLVGTWEQGTEEIRRNLMALPYGILLDLSGRFFLTISAEGIMTFAPQALTYTVMIGDEPAAVDLVGFSVSEFTTPVEGTIVTSSESTSFVITATTAAGSASYPLGGFGGAPVGEWNYTCSDTTLTAIIPPALAPFGTSTYMRISDIPALP